MGSNFGLLGMSRITVGFVVLSNPVKSLSSLNVYYCSDNDDALRNTVFFLFAYSKYD